MQVMATELFLICVYLVLLLSIHCSLVTAKDWAIALPSCRRHCGNVIIPYPFGIGEGCYGSIWHEVVCNRTTSGGPSKAFLVKLELEVLDITLPEDDYGSKIVVNNRAIPSGCSRSGSSNLGFLNLTGSPFVISEQNVFIALGCNSRWLLQDVEPEIAGCQTTCGKKDHVLGDDASCNGEKCCNVSIPKDLQLFRAGIDDHNTSRGCRVGFLNDGSFPYKVNVSNKALEEISYMSSPVVLEWGVLGTASGLDSYATIKCHTRSISRSDFHFKICRCRSGNRGNPYLHRGCEDVKGLVFVVWPITLGVVIGVGQMFLTAGVCWLRITLQRRMQMNIKRRFFKRNGGLLLQKHLSSMNENIEIIKIFSSEELEKATEGFNRSRILGHGGQGTVYKGMLMDGKIVAVKKSKIFKEDNIEGFINEVVILSQINHRNIVKLIGCCLETDSPLLVYEFIPNGNLSQHIHSESEDFSMTWQARLRIATEIAGALYHLHSTSSIPIYHRDIKSSNILLDEKCRAKVCDFGTSRYINLEQTHLTTQVTGTAGYVDPEYFQSCQFTAKSDVYSFGVLLAELLTGQKPVSNSRPQEGRLLATYFTISMEGGKLFDILDARILGQCEPEQVRKVAKLTRRCIRMKGKYRPTMKEVVTELERIQSPEIVSQVEVQNEQECEALETPTIRSWDSGYTAQSTSHVTSSSVESLYPQNTS